jgi:hypothetical protein
MSDDSALGSSSVPHGDAPGDHAREGATVVRIKTEDYHKVAVFCDGEDERPQEWLEIDESAAMEIER